MSDANNRYQPEIDGLRAVAMLLILLYHFNLAVVTHGFLSIDLFFVISGYLVGGMILRQLDNGRFNPTEFIRRRITRLFPMLALTCVLVLAFGYMLLLPEDLAATAASVRAAIAIHANHHFYETISYFGPGKHEQHMLHSWSLSLEEQFYLLFPLGAVVLRWSKLPRGWALMAAIIVAFAIAEIGRNHSESLAYYWLAGRAWQLLLGVWLACIAIRPAAHPERTGWIGAAALSIIIGLCAWHVPMSEDADQLARIGVTVATAILMFSICAAPQTPLGRLLASQPLRVIGQSSYSIYLLHWPLLTLAMNWHVTPLPGNMRAGLALLAILIGLAAWRWIEMPLRRAGNRPEVKARIIFALGAAVALAIWFAAGQIIASDGNEERLSPSATQLLQAKNDFNRRRAECHSDESAAPIKPELSCRFGANTFASVAVWGDSHAAELSATLGHELGQFGQSALQMSSSSCPPVSDVTVLDKTGCDQRNMQVLAYLVGQPGIKTVVLAMGPDMYGEGLTNAYLDGMVRSAIRLDRAGKKVIVIGPFPLPRFHVPKVMAGADNFSRREAGLRVTRHGQDARALPLLSRLEAGLAGSNVTLINPLPIMCNAKLCPLRIDGGLSHFDDNHISMASARRLARALVGGMREE